MFAFFLNIEYLIDQHSFSPPSFGGYYKIRFTCEWKFAKIVKLALFFEKGYFLDTIHQETDFKVLSFIIMLD